MRTWVVVAVVLVGTQASASGLSAEVGGGLVGNSFGGDLAINARITLAVGGDVEIRARGFLGPGGSSLPAFQGATLGARYRTASFGSTVAFSFAFGAGAVLSTACLVGDFCGGLGPYTEINPTLEFHFTQTTHLFVAANLDVGVVVLGNPAFWLAAGLSVGVGFDLGPQAPAPSMH
jgi:hypothetical protein